MIISTYNTSKLKVGDFIKISTCEKPLGVKINYKLTFDNHVANLCKKAKNKIRALAPYMTIEKRKLLMHYFFNAQLNYYRLIWMLHSRCNNNKIKYLHERCLRLIYCDKNSSYEELVERDGSVFIHHRNVQNLATEIYKVKSELVPLITANVFKTIPENHYNPHNYNGFRLPFARTAYHGNESISYLGPKIWDIVPIGLKNARSVYSFKKSIMKWIPNNCPCKRCKRYVDGVDFL